METIEGDRWEIRINDEIDYSECSTPHRSTTTILVRNSNQGALEYSKHVISSIDWNNLQNHSSEEKEMYIAKAIYNLKKEIVLEMNKKELSFDHRITHIV